MQAIYVAFYCSLYCLQVVISADYTGFSNSVITRYAPPQVMFCSTSKCVYTNCLEAGLILNSLNIWASLVSAVVRLLNTVLS